MVWRELRTTAIMTDKEIEEVKEEKRGKGPVVFGYPLSIFFIVVNEFCERFSYYGMRALLVLYFKYFFKWDDDFATSIYHVFVAFCYLMPILGATIADSWLGKFKTIVYLSIVYAAGQIAMAVSAVHDITDQDRNGIPDNLTFHVVLSMFTNKQEKQRSTFFSVFYLCINGGSLLSTIITPILRAQQCGIHTKADCFPLAFGIPAILMVVSLVVFIAGSPMYYKAKPQGNIMLKVCKCIGFAIKNRYRHRSKKYPKKEHWMDWAEEKYGKLLIAQIKMVLRVLFLYLPLPMFWALFDQKGSRWTLQATTLNGDFGVFDVQPDQMQTFNPILILTLVPIMDNIVYPLIKKCGFNFSPLRRITLGMFLAAMAFVAAGLLQLEVDKTLPTFPSDTESQLKLLNMAPNTITVQLPGNQQVELLPNQASPEYFTFDTNSIAVSVGNPPVVKNIALTMGHRQTLLIPTILGNPWQLTDDLTAKPEKGSNGIRFVNGLSIPINISSTQANFGIIGPSLASNYSLLKKAREIFTIRSNSESCDFERDFGFGSSYMFFIPSTFTFTTNCGDAITAAEDIKPNTFSYSQAPSNMKAVLQAGWLLTNAVGNFIVLIVAELAKLPKQWTEYILFASLLVAVCFIFSIMAYFYTYINPAEIEAQIINDTKRDDDDDHDDEEKKPRKNSQTSDIEMEKKPYDNDNIYQTKM
ncbi:hypothetical protein WMY93_028669 [Mugilogobius chulae]|uniref:Solute carrier family 15 member 1 n=1 Tax=Mugilogobius chulae TaxID=88201 RepID=A0AAW0MQW5_9GOBI